MATRSGNTGQRLAPKSAPRRFPNAISVLVLAAVCAILLPGCGGGKKPARPLDDALGYFPKNAALVAVVAETLTRGKLNVRLERGGCTLGPVHGRVNRATAQAGRIGTLSWCLTRRRGRGRYPADDRGDS